MDLVSQKKVLFLCIGNACRSQMAEGFARELGADVMIPASAGLSPAISMPPLTIKVMKEKSISVAEHFPKDISFLRNIPFDLIINMSGKKVPPIYKAKIEDWKVKDPMGKDEETYRTTRDDIEGRVKELVVAIRSGKFDT